MRTLLAALLLCLSIPANAEHHRGHALNQATQAERVASGMRHWACQRMFNNYQRPAGISDEDNAFLFGHVKGACTAAQKIEEELTYVISVLSDPEMSSYTLLDLRRLINKPRKHDENGKGLKPESILYRFGIIGHHMQYIIRENYDSYASYAIIGHQKGAWEFTDFLLWHINDAIIEELYTPPAFE